MYSDTYTVFREYIIRTVEKSCVCLIPKTIFDPLFLHKTWRYGVLAVMCMLQCKALITAQPAITFQNTKSHYYTDMRHLTAGIRSEKCVVRRFRRCANVYLYKPRYYSLLHT